MRQQIFVAIAVAALLGCAASVNADSVTLVNGATGWTWGANCSRVYSDGSSFTEDAAWTTGDNIAGQYKEWLWLNAGTAWKSLIPAGQEIVSATLTFPEANNVWQPPEEGARLTSVFEVPGADKGKAAMGLATGTSAAFYESHMAYGAVTQAQVDAMGPISFDITNLVKGWYNNSLPTNQGQMMILTDSYNYRMDFGIGSGDLDHTNTQDPSFGPTITVTTTPEPNTLVLATTALFGLLAYAWRKRK